MLIYVSKWVTLTNMANIIFIDNPGVSFSSLNKLHCWHMIHLLVHSKFAIVVISSLWSVCWLAFHFSSKLLIADSLILIRTKIDPFLQSKQVKCHCDQAVVLMALENFTQLIKTIINTNNKNAPVWNRIHYLVVLFYIYLVCLVMIAVAKPCSWFLFGFLSRLTYKGIMWSEFKNNLK